MYTIHNYIHMYIYIYINLRRNYTTWFDNAPSRNIDLLAKPQSLGKRNFFQVVHQGSPRDSQNNVAY